MPSYHRNQIKMIAWVSHSCQTGHNHSCFAHQSGESVCCIPNTILPPKLIYLVPQIHTHTVLVTFFICKKVVFNPFLSWFKISLFHDYFFLVKNSEASRHPHCQNPHVHIMFTGWLHFYISICFLVFCNNQVHWLLIPCLTQMLHPIRILCSLINALVKRILTQYNKHQASRSVPLFS